MDLVEKLERSVAEDKMKSGSQLSEIEKERCELQGKSNEKEAEIEKLTAVEKLTRAQLKTETANLKPGLGSIEKAVAVDSQRYECELDKCKKHIQKSEQQKNQLKSMITSLERDLEDATKTN